MIKVGFFGLTHLGLVTSIAFSKKNLKITAYDPNLKTITDGKKIFKIKEPYIEKKIYNNKNINFTDKLDCLLESSLIYISYDIPTDSNGNPDYSLVYGSLNILKNSKYKGVVVIHSQLRPGFLRGLPKFNFKEIYYQVETLVFGEAFKRALNPERIIVGQKDKFRKINETYLKVLKKFNCQIIEMSYESAELTKIAINIFLISSITCSNFLSSVAKSIGADWSDISQSLKLDKRIGKFAYLKPSLGLSGGNLERDLKAVIDISTQYSVNSDYAKTLKKLSSSQSKWLLNKINECLKNKNNKVGFLGITYKENTNSIKNSPACKIIDINKFNITFYDPLVKKYKSFESLKSVNSLLKDADILVVTTPWEEFKKINFKEFIRSFKGHHIIDPYNIFKDFNLKKYNYHSL